MKIAILGAHGKLGSVLAREYATVGEVTAYNRAALDIASPEAIEQTLGAASYDMVLNCAAQANVDLCEQNPTLAEAINATAVERLAEICTRRKMRLIHFSTDYVFDGRSDRPYVEGDLPNPIGAYGRSKWRGEQAIAAVSGDHLIVRVSWVFGPFGAGRPSFIDQTLQRAMRGEPLEGIVDKWSIPTSAVEIARELRPFLREIDTGGVLHLTQSGEPCSWQEYAQAAVESASDAGVPLQSRHVAGRRMSEIAAFIGPRPVYTPLATARLQALTGRSPRPWREALSEYVRQYYAQA